MEDFKFNLRKLNSFLPFRLTVKTKVTSIAAMVTTSNLMEVANRIAPNLARMAGAVLQKPVRAIAASASC